MKKVEKIIKLAFEQNSQNNRFPLWGTCLGFEAIIHAFSRYEIPRTYINTENKNMKIKWIKENYENSEFSKVLRKSIADTMSEEPISYFAQHFGFTLNAFNGQKPLRENFLPIGYYEKKGKKIVSAIQHKYFPIVGTQFHPEKVLFEHKNKVNVKLTRESAIASQELARILFDNAMKNTNVFHDIDMLERLELKSFKSRKTMSVFESVYLFQEDYFNIKNLIKRPVLNKVK